MQAIRWMALAAAAAIAVPGNAADYPDVQRSSLYVPVRDGTRLAVNIYRPAAGWKVRRCR